MNDKRAILLFEFKTPFIKYSKEYNWSSRPINNFYPQKDPFGPFLNNLNVFELNRNLKLNREPKTNNCYFSIPITEEEINRIRIETFGFLRVYMLDSWDTVIY